jgi:hypothetical protein
MDYFDGWANPVSNFHYEGLVRPGVNGQFPQYRPLSGWRDNTLASMRASLTWAHQDGVDFFFFDWFYPPPDPSLNTALTNYLRLPDHDGVGAALFYINIDPFTVPQSEWRSTVEQWVTQDFTNPDYTRIDGKPLLYIDDPVRFNQQWGGTAGVNEALATLREVAIAHGFPGVFVLSTIYVGTCLADVGWDYFAAMLNGETWDALTPGSEPAAACARDGAQPYSDLVSAGEQSWDYYAQRLSEFPTIPSIQGGWDGRPANEYQLGHLWWFERTPDEFGAYVRAAVAWADDHPEQRVEPPPTRPLVMVWAWNELQEGQQLMPTVGDGYSYGQALAEAVGLPRPLPTRDMLSITATRGGSIKALPAAASCRHSCSTSINYGWQVALHAAPQRGLTFRGWQGACKGRNPSCSFIIERDTTASATFTRSH